MSEVTAPATLPSLSTSTSTITLRPPKILAHYVFSNEAPIADPYTAPPQESLSADALLVKKIITDQELGQTQFLGEFLSPGTNEHNLYISTSSGSETYLYVAYLGVAPVRPENMYSQILSNGPYKYTFLSPLPDSDWPVTNGADVVRKIGNELFYETDARNPVPVPIDVLLKKLHFGKRILLPADLVFAAATANTDMSTQFALDKAKTTILTATGGVPLTTAEQATTAIKANPISVPAAVVQPIATTTVTIPSNATQTATPPLAPVTVTPTTVITSPTQVTGPVVITEPTVITRGGTLTVISGAPIITPIHNIAQPDSTNTQLSRLSNRIIFSNDTPLDISDGVISIELNGQELASITVTGGQWYGEIPAMFISGTNLTIKYPRKDGSTGEYTLGVPTESETIQFSNTMLFGSDFNARLNQYGLSLPFDTLAYRKLAWDLMDMMFEKGIPYGNWDKLGTVICGKIAMINKYYVGAVDYEYWENGTKITGPIKRLAIEDALAFANADISNRPILGSGTENAIAEKEKLERIAPPTLELINKNNEEWIRIKVPKYSVIYIDGALCPALFGKDFLEIKKSDLSNRVTFSISRINQSIPAGKWTIGPEDLVYSTQPTTDDVITSTTAPGLITTIDETYAITVGRNMHGGTKTIPIETQNQTVQTHLFDNNRYVLVNSHTIGLVTNDSQSPGTYSVDMMSDRLSYSGIKQSRNIYPLPFFLYDHTDYNFNTYLTYNTLSSTQAFQTSCAFGSRGVYDNYGNINIELPAYTLFDLSKKSDGGIIDRTALVQKQDGGFYFYPGNHKDGSSEFEAKRINLIDTYQKLRGKTNNADLDSIISALQNKEYARLLNVKSTSGVIFANQTSSGQSIPDGDIRTYLSGAGAQSTLPLSDPRVTRYVTHIVNRLHKPGSSVKSPAQAMVFFSKLQETFLTAQASAEIGQFGQMSLLLLSKLDEYIQNGMLAAITPTNTLDGDLAQLPQQMGLLPTSTSVKVKDTTVTVISTIGKKTTTYELTLSAGKVTHITTSGNTAQGSDYFSQPIPLDSAALSAADKNYLYQKVVQALATTGDDVLKNMLEVDASGNLVVLSQKAIDKYKNSGQFITRDSETIFFLKADISSPAKPVYTLIENGKGSAPFAIRFTQPTTEGSEGTILLKLPGQSEWQPMHWNIMGLSNAGKCNSGVCAQDFFSDLFNFAKSLFEQWVVSMAGGWLLSALNESLKGVQIAQQAMQAVQWANTVKQTAEVFIAPIKQSLDIVNATIDLVKNPQKLLEGAIPHEVTAVQQQVQQNIATIEQNIAPIVKAGQTLDGQLQLLKSEYETKAKVYIKIGDHIIEETNGDIAQIKAQIDTTQGQVSTQLNLDIKKLKEKYADMYPDIDWEHQMVQTNIVLPKTDGSLPFADAISFGNSFKFQGIWSEINIPEYNFEEVIQGVTLKSSIRDGGKTLVLEKPNKKLTLNYDGTASFDQVEDGVWVSYNDSGVEAGDYSFENFSVLIQNELEGFSALTNKNRIYDGATYASIPNPMAVGFTAMATDIGGLSSALNPETGKLSYYAPGFQINPDEFKSIETIHPTETIKVRSKSDFVQAIQIMIEDSFNKVFLDRSKAFQTKLKERMDIIKQQFVIMTDDEIPEKELTKDLAYISDWIYGKQPEILDNNLMGRWKPILIDGKETFQDPINGYAGAFLVDETRKIIVMAHRGTELPFGFNDYEADVEALITNRVPGQIYSAIKYYEKFSYTRLYKGYRFIHTGHSLGGAISQVMAATHHDTNFNDEAKTFSALGGWTIAKSLGNNVKWLDQERKYILNFVNKSDFIPPLIPYVGKVYIENNSSNSIGFRVHCIDSFKDGFQKADNQTEYIKHILPTWGYFELRRIGL